MDDTQTNPTPEATEVGGTPTDAVDTSIDTEPTDTDLEEGQDVQEETEEVEWDGKKYVVPKPLKAGLMMQKDYTQKTQEVAETRRALEARERQIAEQAQTRETHFKESAKLVAIQERLEQFDNVDWATLRAQDPDRYNQVFQDRMLLREAEATQKERIAALEQKRQSDAQLEQAKRVENARSVLARDIPGWSETLYADLLKYAIEKGVPAEQAYAMTDPVVFKVLHDGWRGSQLAKKQAAQAPKAPAVEAKPVPQVGTRTPPPAAGLSDKLSIDTWMRRRNDELRKRG